MRIVVAGALGEVGAAVAASLRLHGHDVVEASARAPIDAAPWAVGLGDADELIRTRSVDLVINAGGRGDRRAAERTGSEGTSLLAQACAAGGLPGVLLSTTRVLEGYVYDYAEDAAAETRSDYAAANARNEVEWLARGGTSVLRITNFFTPPTGADTPQALLLPWSLVTEAVSQHRIEVRSGASTVKEFVGAADVATAALLLAGASERPTHVATVPGSPFTLLQLAQAAGAGVVAAGYQDPELSFGEDVVAGPVCRPGWLAQQGWVGRLTLEEVTAQISEWVTRTQRPTGYA